MSQPAGSMSSNGNIREVLRQQVRQHQKAVIYGYPTHVRHISGSRGGDFDLVTDSRRLDDPSETRPSQSCGHCVLTGARGGPEVVNTIRYAKNARIRITERPGTRRRVEVGLNNGFARCQKRDRDSTVRVRPGANNACGHDISSRLTMIRKLV